MNNTPLLSLTPQQFALSKPLSDDIEFIDALLGNVLSQQEDVEIVAIARALYVESDEDPRELAGDRQSTPFARAGLGDRGGRARRARSVRCRSAGAALCVIRRGDDLHHQHDARRE
jgi:hypothetical protein